VVDAAARRTFDNRSSITFKAFLCLPLAVPLCFAVLSAPLGMARLTSCFSPTISGFRRFTGRDGSRWQEQCLLLLENALFNAHTGYAIYAVQRFISCVLRYWFVLRNGGGALLLPPSGSMPCTFWRFCSKRPWTGHYPRRRPGYHLVYPSACVDIAGSRLSLRARFERPTSATA